MIRHWVGWHKGSAFDSHCRGINFKSQMETNCPYRDFSSKWLLFPTFLPIFHSQLFYSLQYLVWFHITSAVYTASWNTKWLSVKEINFYFTSEIFIVMYSFIRIMLSSKMSMSAFKKEIAWLQAPLSFMLCILVIPGESEVWWKICVDHFSWWRDGFLVWACDWWEKSLPCHGLSCEFYNIIIIWIMT